MENREVGNWFVIKDLELTQTSVNAQLENVFTDKQLKLFTH